MKKVLLTGGSRGIGKAIYNNLYNEGYEVIAPTRDELNLESLTSIEKFIINNKNIEFNYIINNAGINPLNYIEDINKEELSECFNVNLIAPILLIQGFVHHMIENKHGKIVNIGSIWGVVSKEKRTVYSVTKTGIIGLTRTLSVELGKYNILVNSVSPGYVNTELTNKNVSKEEREKLYENIPLKRFADTDEIANIVCYLISDKNTYMTGQNIVIDGGYTIK